MRSHLSKVLEDFEERLEGDGHLTQGQIAGLSRIVEDSFKSGYLSALVDASAAAQSALQHTQAVVCGTALNDTETPTETTIGAFAACETLLVTIGESISNLTKESLH